MTFNRYIAIRAAVEIIGMLSCALMVVIGHNLIGVIVTAVVAAIWAGGEIWVVTVLNRKSPRRDELSDQHQGAAMQFALFMLIAALVALGFIYTVWNLVTASGLLHIINPMMLPTLAMCALAISDVRYLWLEHDGSNGDDDED
ncbi:MULTISPECIES: hypothetical protein [unclassified Bifidobacterium]|uniref:hypothetical protein n=1 Tax=unclassified Bifidobacterium TaxID=2608897 RepID=UPI001126A256|nr:MULTISPECIES: hypothetical protein [unclassified Bifidobacterium]TPF78538.1 hypothetical protein BW09_03455 [Bifidobacterium sp. UTCIF-1]TPF80818.1 hypothetical protein BW08_02410 [Bifidobacterium sp. UTCIF-24]TPF82742.1 hypothetical protein BW12_03210 [Bifidobacterium sp. UTCIF-3]TPF84485.1 hypothetical protein BW07_04345 [Bifidobacterium sp. UTCIF-36]TPF90955.1 hypothetical protein BW10_01685 [Bifidobacterium sp. UTBIF-56]